MPEDGPAPDRANGGSPRASLDELRNLLLDEDRRRLSQLDERVESSGLNVERLSRILPDAVHRSRQDGKQLGRSLSPLVEQAIGVSVRKNPRPLVDAIFPVIGPAIRRSIGEALHSMVQAFNQTLEHSLSPRSLRWRWEAWRTGRPFAEVVLLHTLLYRVEQVFLIHRPSGLLLHHVQDPLVGASDADLMSGMLSAIQDFVKDSLEVDPEASLESFRVGDLEVWVESGPHALLATVLRGEAPVRLREQLRDTIESIHRDRGEELTAFEGDAAAFDTVRPELEECLVRVKAPDAERRPWVLRWVPALVLVAAVALFVAWWIRDHARFDYYVEALRQEPGIVVVTAEYGWLGHEVSGLRDPVAVDPALLLEGSGLTPDRVHARWQPVLSLDDEITSRRARASLEPPHTVSLTTTSGRLVASGRADHSWVERFRQRAPVLTGVSAVEDGGLVDVDLEHYEDLRRAVEARSLDHWEPDSPISAEILDELTQTLEAVLGQAAAAGRTPRLVVVEADVPGTERARALVAGLGQRGLPVDRMSWPDTPVAQETLRLPAAPEAEGICLRPVDAADGGGGAP